MFQMKNDMQTAVKHNIRGGEGSPCFRYLFSAEQLGSRAGDDGRYHAPTRRIRRRPPARDERRGVLHPRGCGHRHRGRRAAELHVGDAEFCADGHTHSIRNHTGSVTRFLAVIVPNR